MPTLTPPDLSKLERPSIEMPDFDLSKIELPKVDIGKAVTDAATSVGLISKRRSRWPFVIVAGIAVAVAGWAWMNADMIRSRASDAASMVRDRLGMMRSDMDDESVAFPAAEPKPIGSTEPFGSGVGTNGSTGTSDYPTGFGSTSDMAGTSGDMTSTFEKTSSR